LLPPYRIPYTRVPGAFSIGAYRARDNVTVSDGAVSEHDQERERLTTLGGLAALSLDALSSVAYGPEAILVVLVTAGVAALKYSLPVTGAIVLLLAALVISYRQVIEAFPDGGGAYAVSKRHLGTISSLVAAASLIVDYVLNAAVGVSAGVEALTAAFPALYGARVWLCLAVLALITGVNLRGVAESARVFTVPTVAFVAAIATVIVAGALRSQPAVPLSHTLPPVTETVGALLILKAFASGCSALTGVEAIANSVPQFRKPRARHAQHTEVWLGVLLGAMLIGLGALIHRWSVVPQPGTTVLAQLTAGAVGHNALFYIIQMITLVLLALAANTSFGGLPVLAGLLAHDNFLPHFFGLRADRRVFRYGVGVLAIAAALLLVAARGDTQALVPLFAVGVFVGFTLSQVGMVRHWRTERSQGWVTKAWINGIGAVLTFAATVIELGSKFLEGAWLVAVIIPLLVLLFVWVRRAYTRIGRMLGIGEIPAAPVKQASLVVVPVAAMSRLAAEGISAALSLGDDVIAVTVVFTDSDDEPAPDVSFRDEWKAWRPEVPLITLRTSHRSIARPIVSYLQAIEAEDKYHRLVVLIPEVQPARPWQWLLHNQRGVILDRAIRHGTSNVVLCRLRYRLATLAADAAEASRSLPDRACRLPPDNVRRARRPLMARYSAWVPTRRLGGDHGRTLPAAGRRRDRGKPRNRPRCLPSAGRARVCGRARLTGPAPGGTRGQGDRPRRRADHAVPHRGRQFGERRRARRLGQGAVRPPRRAGEQCLDTA
jgi:amino acid transporter